MRSNKSIVLIIEFKGVVCCGDVRVISFVGYTDASRVQLQQVLINQHQNRTNMGGTCLPGFYIRKSRIQQVSRSLL